MRLLLNSLCECLLSGLPRGFQGSPILDAQLGKTPPYFVGYPLYPLGPRVNFKLVASLLWDRHFRLLAAASLLSDPERLSRLVPLLLRTVGCCGCWVRCPCSCGLCNLQCLCCNKFNQRKMKTHLFRNNLKYISKINLII